MPFFLVLFFASQLFIRTVSAQVTPAPATSTPGIPAPARFPEIIRGRIIDDSMRPILTNVYVTRGSDRSTQQATTDSAGYYRVRFAEGTGDYLVFVSAPGFQSARRRVQRQGVDTEFVVNFTLVRQVNMLAAVRVSARRSSPPTNGVNPTNPEAGSMEQWKQGVNSQPPPILSGNLNAIASTMPNVTVGASGPSILGVGGGSNLNTLNGMGFAAGAIPRAARTETRVTASTYDPARGGFTGANVDVRLGPGDRMFQNRNAFVTINPRQWQFADATGQAFGGPNGGITASFGADGELIQKALTYNVSFELARDVSTPSTLLSAEPGVLSRLGVSPDSATRLTAIAPTVGLALARHGIPSGSQHEGFIWLGRLDDTRDTLQTRALTTYVGFNRLGGLGFTPLAAPSTAAKQHDRTLGTQLTFGTYVGSAQRVLTVTRFAASQVHTSTTPYYTEPSAFVLIPSLAEDGTTNISGVTLGGGSFSATNATSWTAEGANETIWYAGGGSRHRLKTQLWGRVDGSHQEGLGSNFGSFTFNSINDFGANQPASFFRTLSQPALDGTVWNTAASLTHSYVPSPSFSMVYGTRLEADGFTSTPARNVALDQALGVRSGAAPSHVHLSPRLGFSFKYNNDQEANASMTSTSPLGSFIRVGSGIISGGIGEFRDLLHPDIRASAGAATGLPGATVAVSCVGSAVPAVDWASFAATPSAIPTQCVAGAGQLAESAPAVTLIDPGYDVPRSWRASLNWTSNVSALRVDIGSLFSYNLSQPGTVDANFSGVPRLTLSSEAGRPVYVSTSGIDPSSGAVSPAESRMSDQFGAVGMRVSDLRGYGGQFTANVSSLNMWPIFMSVGYNLQWVRREYRGFDGAAFGDPRVREWAPDADDARHVIVLSGGWASEKLGTLTFFSRLQSGLPFTPIVQGDVNGDGRVDDRAFIPNPMTTDARLSSQLQSLLANGVPSARHCLNAYLGRVAPLNGCRGPWTQSLNLQWSPNIAALQVHHIQSNIYFQNVLAGLDQALHNDHSLRGWGGQATPDPVLLIPRGFDPTTQQFAYDVNPRFGDTRSGRSFSLNPFQIMIDFRVDLSTDYDVQQLRRAVEPERGPHGWQQRSAASITTSYLATTSDIYKMAIVQSDSLFLTAKQIAALEQADSAYSQHVRDLYVPLGKFLVERESRTGQAELDSVKVTQKLYWKIFWEQVDIAATIITPVQREYFDLLKSLLQIPAANREYTTIRFGDPVTLAP